MKRFTLNFWVFLAAVLFTGAYGYAGNPLGLTWGEVGPNNVGNHTRAMAVDGDGNVFAGSVGGGLWKSTNGGTTWFPVRDAATNVAIAENLAISSIAIDGSNIYVGTGELIFGKPAKAVFGTTYDLMRNDREYWTIPEVEKHGFHQYAPLAGEGVFVSTDGGSTWNHNNATWGGGPVAYDAPFRSIQRIVAEGGKVWIAALDGLYWSTDGLASVTKSNGTTNFTTRPIHDVELGLNNKVYACTADSIYISTNGGNSFGGNINGFGSDLDHGETPNTFRAAIAVAPSNKDIVYATYASGVNGSCSGVWKSVDGGSSWQQVAPRESSVFNPFQNEGLYNLILEVDPVDPSAFIISGAAWFTFDQTTGLTQSVSHFWIPGFITDYVPTPTLCVAFDPNDPETHYVGTDAEIVKSEDGGDTYLFKTKGFNAGHIYSVSSAPNWKVIASDRYAGLIYKSNSSTSDSLKQMNIVDNGVGKVQFSMVDFDHAIGPANFPDGGILRSLNNGGSWESFYEVPKPDTPSYLFTSDSLFINRADDQSAAGAVYDIPIAEYRPWCFDAVIPSTALQHDSLIKQTPEFIFMTSRNFVWVCCNPFGPIDSLPAWNRITNDLISGSAAGNTTPNEVFTYIQVSGDDNHVVLVGTNYGKLHRIYNANDVAGLDSTDFGTINTAGMPERWITNISFDPNDPNNCVVTYGAFATGDARVMISNNALDANPANVTFRDITGDLPDIPVYSAAFHPDASKASIILGTEKGVYTSTDDYENAGTSHVWNQENGGMDFEAPVYDVQFRRYYALDLGQGHYSYQPDNTLMIGTHGRGVWSSSSVVSREEALPSASLGYDVSLYPNPASERSMLEFQVPQASTVSVEVITIDGRTVMTIPANEVPAGVTKLSLSNARLNSGIYLIKTTITNGQGTFTKTLKSVVTK